MRTIRNLSRAAESVPEAAESVVAAGDRLREGIDVATAVLFVTLVFSSCAVILAMIAVERTERPDER